MNVVLYHPEIPGNTGTIGRTCVALGASLSLIKPYGFDLSEKSVRRAGLDYWKHVQLKEYDSWKEFDTQILKSESVPKKNVFFFSKKGKQDFFEAKFHSDSYLIFGAETMGLPQIVHEEFSEQVYRIPMVTDKVRSLNLSNAVSVVMYEVFRQQRNF